jgi:predicted amidohydrolase
MTRLFGIAGVQMSVVPWDPAATVSRMEEAIEQVAANFPWVQMILFHELAPSAAAPLVSALSTEPWLESAQSIPVPLSTHL